VLADFLVEHHIEAGGDVGMIETKSWRFSLMGQYGDKEEGSVAISYRLTE
jgi:hypothetical protein